MTYLKLTKITKNIIFVIVFIFFSTLQVQCVEKFNKANKIADYFSGIVLLNQNNYNESFQYLRKLDGLENVHASYSLKYLYSLINSGNFYQAFIYSKKLEKQKKSSFESNLIIGIYYLKKSKFNESKKYFLKAKQKKPRLILDNYIIDSLYNWSSVNSSNLEKSEFILNQMDDRFNNLKKIQRVFLNCFFKDDKTELEFEALLNNEDIDFSRYNYFFVKYLDRIGKRNKAKTTLNNSLGKFPRNLLLNQHKLDRKNSKISSRFNCEKVEDVVAEILYITANALSSQSIYSLSNFYLNLAKYLNKNFHAFDTLSC